LQIGTERNFHDYRLGAREGDVNDFPAESYPTR
jgi:hypothetical protein